MPNLTVTDAADSKDWVGSDNLVDELEITTLTEQLARMVEDASRRCLTFINWGDIAFQRYTERVAGAGDTILLLSRAPVVKVETVYQRTVEEVLAGDAGTLLEDWVLEDAEAGTLYRRGTWLRYSHGVRDLGIVLTNYADPRHGDDEENYEIDYWAGYLMPKQTDPADTGGSDPVTPDTLPAEFRDAALAQAKGRYLRRKRSSDVASKKVDDTSISFHRPDERQLAQRFGLEPEAFYALLHHRRVDYV